MKIRKVLPLLLVSFCLSPTFSLFRSKYVRDVNLVEQYTSVNSHKISYPAIFSSPMYSKDSELYYLVAQLDIMDMKDGRIFYLIINDDELTNYNAFIPEITFEHERTKSLQELPKPYNSSYGGENDYSTISDTFSCFRSLEGSYQTISALENQYPSLVEVVNIGLSYLKTIGEGGYHIKLLKLTNKSSKVEKSHLFVICALHVRELATSEACARFTEYMLSNYGIDADITWILDYTEIHVVLQSNPDGREDEESQVSNGVNYYRRKNMNFDTENTPCFSSSGGVDLNRNFPHSEWGTVGVSYWECSSIYPGTFGASEPEVDAIVKYVESIIPPGTNTVDENGAYTLNSTGVFMDIHSYGEDFFYPWGYKDENPPNHQSLVAMAKKLASHTSPVYSSNNDVYATSGDSTDWAYESIGVAAYTMELGEDFYQSCSYFEENVAPSTEGALLYAARVAKAPFLYPTGPDVMEITLLLSSADTLDVKVKVSDSLRASGYSTGSQVVSEIKLYLNVHPYDSSSEASSVVDTGFTSSTEIATLSVNISGLASGEHTMYVQAKDSDGTPGPVYASYFSVSSANATDDPNNLDDFVHSNDSGLLNDDGGDDGTDSMNDDGGDDGTDSMNDDGGDDGTDSMNDDGGDDGTDSMNDDGGDDGTDSMNDDTSEEMSAFQSVLWLFASVSNVIASFLLFIFGMI